MTPIPTEWWLRPDSNAARVGAHSAVVWKRLYFRPLPASLSAVGVAHGPPNALDAAKPTASSKMTRKLGAPPAAEPAVVEKDAESVGPPRRWLQRPDRGKRRVGVLGVVRERSFERPV